MPCWQAEPNPAAKHFYEEAAAAAAALGVCVDVYAASEEGLGLAYIQPLSRVSGGVMLLYPSLADAALPQVCTYFSDGDTLMKVACVSHGDYRVRYWLSAMCHL